MFEPTCRALTAGQGSPKLHRSATACPSGHALCMSSTRHCSAACSSARKVFPERTTMLLSWAARSPTPVVPAPCRCSCCASAGGGASSYRGSQLALKSTGASAGKHHVQKVCSQELSEVSAWATCSCAAALSCMLTWWGHLNEAGFPVQRAAQHVQRPHRQRDRPHLWRTHEGQGGSFEFGRWAGECEALAKSRCCCDTTAHLQQPTPNSLCSSSVAKCRRSRSPASCTASPAPRMRTAVAGAASCSCAPEPAWMSLKWRYRLPTNMPMASCRETGMGRNNSCHSWRRRWLPPSPGGSLWSRFAAAAVVSCMRAGKGSAGWGSATGATGATGQEAAGQAATEGVVQLIRVCQRPKDVWLPCFSSFRRA